MRVLVAGGAGYIGSHALRELISAGHEPVVIDNLIYGHRAAVPDSVVFAEGALSDERLVRGLLKNHRIEAVMHFAAFAYVGESVEKPLLYYDNNLATTVQLLKAMQAEGVRKFVFSSTCATYGVPEKLPIVEGTPQAPINPYGRGKWMVESILRDLAAAGEISCGVFRYFNAAGAAADGSIGEDHDPETHLIPLVIDAALGRREAITIFGTDYPTPDGTCLRDYVHVEDLASAHVKVLDRLEQPGTACFYNLGTGQPASVREVIRAVEKVSGKTVPIKEAARRPGDPPALYADATLARKELDWQLRYPALEPIVETAWNWHAGHPRGYRS